MLVLLFHIDVLFQERVLIFILYKMDSKEDKELWDSMAVISSENWKEKDEDVCKILSQKR